MEPMHSILGLQLVFHVKEEHTPRHLPHRHAYYAKVVNTPVLLGPLHVRCARLDIIVCRVQLAVHHVHMTTIPMCLVPQRVEVALHTVLLDNIMLGAQRQVQEHAQNVTLIKSKLG
jgi:hypothetical protein